MEGGRKRRTALPQHTQRVTAAPVCEGNQATVGGQMRYLLVVDRDGNERFTMSMLLQRFGYTVASTSSASEAIDFLCVAPADAVFVEAGETGDDLTERLQGDARFKGVPVVMVTESPDRSLEARLRKDELAGLLRKPLDPDDVFLVIQKVIEKGTRRNIRIPTVLPAVLHTRTGVSDGYVTVLSQFGMFFRSLEPLSVKMRATVEIPLWSRNVIIEAEVLYSVTFEEGPFCEPGMGMKFTKIEPEDSVLIKHYIYEQLGMEIGRIVPGKGPAAGQA